ncbi:MAG: ABC transporter substrate-binding protein [Peptostreptococcaceae bacterium]|nr:ABC transporter substrate-binding protein [Peptostreptococcaceae bacterium]
MRISYLGQIFAREERAKELILSLREEEEHLRSQGESTLRVFCFDSAFEGKAFTCGHSLESYIIRRAGGRNIFEDRASIFALVDWKEVAAADPQAILVHRFHDSHDSDAKIKFLKRVSEIAGTEAIRKGNFMTLGMKEVFPNLGILSTTRKLGEFFDSLQNRKEIL